jgi:hypothetical protein
MALLKKLEQRLRKAWKRWREKPELPRLYRSQERFRKRSAFCKVVVVSAVFFMPPFPVPVVPSQG